MEHWELFFRLVNVVGCLFALWILGQDFRKYRKSWNVKTQDHWLALVAWVIVGFSGAIEAISRGISVGPTTPIKWLAVAVTLRALLRKGEVVAERKQAPWKKED